jgi:hypothetical protein
MSPSGHSRPGRASSKFGHVRYAPIAIQFRKAANVAMHISGLMHRSKGLFDDLVGQREQH